MHVPSPELYTCRIPPRGVTPLGARENFFALAGPLSTNVVRRPRHRSVNYSTAGSGWASSPAPDRPPDIPAPRGRLGRGPENTQAPQSGGAGRSPTAVERVRRPSGSPTAPFASLTPSSQSPAGAGAAQQSCPRNNHAGPTNIASTPGAGADGPDQTAPHEPRASSLALLAAFTAVTTCTAWSP